jgi:hypothetical protein
MGEGRHTSECPVRLESKQKRFRSEDAVVIHDLETWRHDPDVKLIIDATCRRYEVNSIADLDPHVLTDLHEAISVLMEEAPPVTFPGDPRRTM